MKQAILFFLFAVLSASAFGQDMLIVSDSTRLTNRDTNIVNLISTANNSRIRWEYSVHNARRLRVYAITPNATARVTAVRVRAVLRKR